VNEITRHLRMLDQRAPHRALAMHGCTTSGGNRLEQHLDQPMRGIASHPAAETTEFPHSSAGNIFQVGIASGKLNGVISPATPMGRR